MEVRCKNCDARLSVPSVGPLKEIQCPKCGVMMMLPPPHRSEAAKSESTRSRRRRDALRKTFEPIPRGISYIAGVLLFAVLSSPFWASALLERFQQKPIFLSEDAQSIPVPTNKTVSPPPIMGGVTTQSAVNLTQYDGVHLDAFRGDLDHRFNLILQNTRGMQPEIYQGRNVGDVELIDARFYDGLLKEVTMLMHDRPMKAETLLKELVDEYGEPQSHTIDDNTAGNIELPGLGLQKPDSNMVRKLASFQKRHTLLWADGKIQMHVTIYTMTLNTGQPISLMQVHLAATSWLNANQPVPTAVTAAPPAAPTAPVAPVPANPAPTSAPPVSSGFMLNGKPL